MKKPVKTKYETLGYLLGEFGSDRITRSQFWGQMNQLGYTQRDIDAWCAMFYELEEKKDAARQARTEGVGVTSNARGEDRRQQEEDRQERRGSSEGVQGQERQDADAKDDGGVQEDRARPVGELWFTLTPEMIKFVDDLAFEHTTAHVQAGSRTTNGQPTDFERRYKDTRNGYRAEAAAYLYFGLRGIWGIQSGHPGKPDFAGFIDAKWRGQLHHKMNIPPNGKPHHAYMLVCGTQHPHYRIVGWCWGSEGMTDDYWYDPGTNRPAWWIDEFDPIMKPPQELKDMVLAGRRS